MHIRLDINDVRYFGSILMAINKQVPGARCQVSGRKFHHLAFFSNLKPGTYNLEPRTYNLLRGFSLIELLVVIAIMVVISSLILVNNSRFGGTVLLQNLAYDIALSVRQAQVYGISVQRFGASNFNAGYGIYFNTSNESLSRSYALFADVSANGLYDSDELVASTDIGRGYRIVKLCAPASVDAASCTQVSRLDITFRRPEPDARIRANESPQISESGRIVVASPRNEYVSIIVEASGQIAVQK